MPKMLARGFVDYADLRTNHDIQATVPWRPQPAQLNSRFFFATTILALGSLRSTSIAFCNSRSSNRKSGIRGRVICSS